MEHYRSTLGTAAVAAIGLLVAARVLHPGNFEELPRPARPVASQSEAALTSVAVRAEPPFGLYMRPSALSPEIAVLAPRLSAPLPPGLTMMPILSAAMANAVGQSRDTGARRQPTAAKRLVHANPTTVSGTGTAHASSRDARSTQVETHEVMGRELTRDEDG
ncbi:MULTISPECIES: hypothetical protein [unclassified Methylobacterium]|uniref:hypothetical protein n=1 Tax=unclassified Methylobacterium TaxID=2615210 RepID=UPI001FB9AEBA|nr:MULTISPECIES: hypothetical protein [unclassified Methylobacterium]MCJ2015552.1 hypothetical protein [Methylobacterium sp. J-076]MCJ2089769.1 hypothetical protein [Methylobacterium sp. E-005]